MSKLRVLSLFAGIGGFDLGLERTGGFETVAFCEIEPFAIRVLNKNWPGVPVYGDVRGLTGERLRADGIVPEVICGGFPCQDISTAGKKVGLSGTRSSLWWEIDRLVGEIRPRLLILENSSALLTRGLSDVLGALASRGYDAEWQCIPASALGAPHGRDRIWIVAYPDDEGQPNRAVNDETRGVQETGFNHAPYSQRGFGPLGRVMEGVGRIGQSLSWDELWNLENSPIGMGVDDGVPNRMDRLRALGNAVVPQIPELIGNAILASLAEERAAA